MPAVALGRAARSPAIRAELQQSTIEALVHEAHHLPTMVTARSRYPASIRAFLFEIALAIGSQNSHRRASAIDARPPR